MSEQLQTSEENGLLIIYDEESSQLIFEWNEETHPQYNFLYGLTAEMFHEMLERHYSKLDAIEKTTDVQNRGSCSGTSEGNSDPEPLA